MEHLPSITWSEVATKSDLEQLGNTLRTELRADFLEQMNRQIKRMVTFAAAWSSLLITVVRFLP